MVGVALFGGWIVWGFALLRLAGVRLRAAERLVVGPVLGLATGSFLLYVLASTVGRLSGGVVAAALAVYGAVAVVAWRRRPQQAPDPVPTWFWWTVGVVGFVLLAMNLWGVLAPVGDAVVAQEHVWADTPFHASIITTFAYRPDYPPTYTIALGEPLDYPFLVDYLSGVLVWAGWSLRAAVVSINVAIHLAFYVSVALLSHRLTRSARAAVLATGVLFCLGNLGFLAVPGDIAEAGSIGAWLSGLPWSYTGDALGDKGLDRLGTGMYLGNPTFMYFLPRRSAAFGLAVAAVLLILFLELLDRRHWGTAVVAGALLGVLPRVHAHSLIAMVAFVVLWCVFLPVLKGRTTWSAWFGEWRAAAPTWVAVGVVALAIGLPQVVAMSRQSEGFAGLWLGWTGQPHEAFERVATDGLGALPQAMWTLLRFWVYNGGLLVILLVPAWLAAGRRLRFFYLPFAFLWLFGNLVRTQPWEWDNSNYFVYWQFGTVVLVTPLLAVLFERRNTLPWLRSGAGVFMIGLLTFGGLLSFLYAAQQRHHLWTASEKAFAERVREGTDPDAIVLTANGHTHPVIALSGRRAFMGFSGWLVTHGLDWESYSTRLERMYRGDLDLMRRLGVDYVVIGPWERNFAADRSFSIPDVFDDPVAFRPVERTQIVGREWALYELRSSPPTDPASGDGVPGRTPSPAAPEQ